jgi:CO dehydrogenase maturation factor
VLIINRVTGEEGERLRELAEESGLRVAGLVPQVGKILEYDLKGKPLLDLPGSSIAQTSVFSILDSLDIP